MQLTAQKAMQAHIQALFLHPLFSHTRSFSSVSQSTQCGVNTKVVVQYSSCSDISKFSPANAGWAVVSWLRRCCWLFQWDVSVVILSYHNDLIPWEERIFQTLRAALCTRAGSGQ